MPSTVATPQEFLLVPCQVSALICRSGGYNQQCRGCQGDGTRVVVIPARTDDG